MSDAGHAERGQGTGALRVLQGLALITPAATVFAPKATVPILLVAFVLLAGHALLTRVRPPWPDGRPVLGLALLIGWALLGAAWSIDADASIRAALSLTGVFAAGLLFVASTRALAPMADRIARSLSIGLALGLAVYAFELVSGNWLTRTGRGLEWSEILDPETGGINVDAALINGTVILSVLFWPAASMLVRARQWVPLAFLACGLAAAVVVYGSTAGLFALTAGTTAWGLSHLCSACAARATGLLFAFVVLATPWVAHRVIVPMDLHDLAVDGPSLPGSAIPRLFIWKFTAERIAERPIVGWGLDTARRIPGGGEKYVVRDTNGRVLDTDFYMPLHPHNQMLQIWLELGAVGAAIVALFGGWMIARTGRDDGTRDPPARAAALALIATASVYGYLSFGAWQSWWLASLFIAAALHTALAAPTTTPSSR